MSGATLLEAFGRPGADRLRSWAAGLATRFRARFLVRRGRRPLSRPGPGWSERQVDCLTSNIGHLLGTGLLNADEETAGRPASLGPALDSGLGLRTMSRADAGYAPLSYHCGSVWPHDTAIVIARTGPRRSGRLRHRTDRRPAACIGCLRSTAARAVERRRPAGSVPGGLPPTGLVGRFRGGRCQRPPCPGDLGP